MSYLFLDTETGGLDRDTSLLSAYFAITDNQFNIIKDLELNIKPDSGNYIVNAQALNINKINLIEHDKTARTYKEAGTIIDDFLNAFQYFQGLNFTKLTPVGQNVKFDIQRINDTVLNRGTWDRFVSYRALEIGSITQYLQLTGKVPAGLSTGLHAMRDFFKIKIEGQDHSAKTDVLISIEVLKNLFKLSL